MKTLPSYAVIDDLDHKTSLLVSGHPLGVANWGAWVPLEDGGFQMTPSLAPWREAMARLEELADGLEDGPVSLTDEADAIFQIFWRYGSYAYVLCAGKTYKPFRQDETISRIGDDEMCRINIEFSAGLDHWLSDVATDPPRRNRLVRAATKHIPSSLRSRRSDYRLDYGLEGDDLSERWAREDAEELLKRLNEVAQEYHGISLQEWARMPENTRYSATMTPRQVANYIVSATYRNNSPLENHHAGYGSEGTDVFGFKRLYAGEVNALARVATSGLVSHLNNRRRIGAELMDFIYTSDFFHSVLGRWSEDMETDSVAYDR